MQDTFEAAGEITAEEAATMQQMAQEVVVGLYHGFQQSLVVEAYRQSQIAMHPFALSPSMH